MLYRFDRFELDLARFELRAAGESIALEPQVFALLALLVENRERMVSKDELVEKVWDGRVVSESAISSRIKSARQALGDDGRAQRFIRTIHGRGFRFVGEVDAAVVVAQSEGPRSSGGSRPESRPESMQEPRPSIAVLPFRVLGDAATHSVSQEAIAQALPHELIAELSRLRWLFVTARASSFRVGSGERDPREVGCLLGVRYLLSGALEITRGRLAVAVELVDTRDAGVVWADRQTAPIDEIHAIRAEIGARVLAALEIQIPLHEAARARLCVSEDLDAWAAYHLGLQQMFRFNRTDNAAAAALFARAIALDPGFARAHAGLSFVHFQTAFLRQTDDLAGVRRLARDSALRGLDLDPIDPFVNFTLGRSYWLEGDLEGSLPWLDRAIAVCPNYAQGIYARGWTESLAGDALVGRAHVDLAMRLSPLDPLHYAMSGTRAFTHIALHEDREAADWADRAARSPGAHVLIAMIAVAAHALAGDEALAAGWAERVRARNPALTRDDFFGAFPMRSAQMKARVSDGLVRHGF
jgi:TolB-like protein